ncbi:MAG: hypothetical protein M1819_002818 [Sarea resinae]|nr:MAG: hypothetical protein M1819_002818 [Sarea resinae]
MPPSQLKRLKESLRDQGIVGPQQSKKQKKKNNASGATKEKRIQRDAALKGIREQFNPFEVKAPARGPKFEVTKANAPKSKGITARPGVTKALGEENRRRTLLVEMQRRNKVGGVNDRRFGENDPTMTPEEKMLERFTREKQARFKKGSLFDLEDDEEGGQLTHFGQSLTFDDNPVDDFDEGDLGVSDEGDHLSEERDMRKRRRSSASEGPDGEAPGEGEEPERKKSKAEVMKEVIAKSKFHKYERQQAREEDDEVREELDKDLPELLALMRGNARPPPPPLAPIASEDIQAGMNPDRAALLDTDRTQAEKEYDERVRQMAFDKRSQPTNRTKTEDEKLEEEAKRLRELEEKRLRRMRGEEESSDGEPEEAPRDLEGDDDFEPDDAAAFGLGPGIPGDANKLPLDVEDEDDFVIDGNLVASGSDVDSSDSDGGDVSSDAEAGASDEEDDDEFVGGLLSKEEASKPEFGLALTIGKDEPATKDTSSSLAYTYPCPQNHEELLQITKGISIDDLPTVVRRIRALYHPKLQSENKERLGVFSTVLIDHIVYLANQPSHPSFSVLETLIRHIHSLAKTYPVEVGRSFRTHLKDFQDNRHTAPTAGDLIILTAIGSIFSTSDHFHSVVTPATLSMTRYLGQKLPQTTSDLATGAYMVTLCLHYQRLSKRYVPEVMNYSLNALAILAPTKPQSIPGAFPYHEPAESLRIQPSSSSTPRPLRFWDFISQQDLSEQEEQQRKLTLIDTNVSLLTTAAILWTGKPAFIPTFTPFLALLTHIQKSPSLPKPTVGLLSKSKQTLSRLLIHARTGLRPLTLHHHRPLAIKTSIPKFEESYQPSKHYDPDRERAETAKLRAEHKREKKGALRELRKDANFVARESLREKKERDAEYEKKYRRLVAEIQGEEGREANAYEREKRLRKGARK